MVYAGTAWAAGLIAAAFSGHLYIAVPAALISALLFKVLFRFSGLFAFTQLFFQTLAQLCDLILLTLTTS